MENAKQRNIIFCKRINTLFKKAHELAILCDAEVGLIIINPDGRIHEFASSNMPQLLARFRMCTRPGYRRALPSKPEEAKEELVALEQEKQEPKSKQLKLLGIDLKRMSLDELRAFNEKLTEGLLCIKAKKIQILMEEIEQSKTKGKQVLQENLTLQGLVEELHGSYPTIRSPVPLSIHFPETRGNFLPADANHFPPSSYAVPLTLDNGPETANAVHFPETRGNFWAEDVSRLPSTSYAALALDNRPPETANGVHFPETRDNFWSVDLNHLPSTSYPVPPALDNVPETAKAVEPADEDPDTTLSLAPTWGWSTYEGTGKETGSSSSRTRAGG